MPKDAFTIYRAAEELKMLVGGKIDKVNMPDRETMILLVHTRSGNHRLLLSCNPSLPRVHITVRKYENPDAASGTLMYFRKRLAGAVITDVLPDRCERMIRFELSALDELRERVSYTLAAELTGKCANIIFVENGVIGNCLRRVTAEAPGKRAVLPGLSYALPNATGRVGIFDRGAFIAAATAFDGVSARTAVNKVVAGLAQTTVDELFFRLGIADDVPPGEAVLNGFLDAAQALYGAQVEPRVTFDTGGRPLDFFAVGYETCGGTTVAFDTLNAAMDAYYSALFDAAELAATAKPLKAAVKSAVTKNKKRLADGLAKADECADSERDRQLGELITANIYRIKRGDSSVTVDNWYDGTTVTVPLDVTKNAAQNAAAYFKSYNKKKRAIGYARAAIDAANAALDRLAGISTELELCTTKTELNEVRDELVALGLIKPQNKSKKVRTEQSEPYTFDIDGATLLVGKNHAQNDRITRSAAKTDIWLHVKDAHGAHAVLKTAEPTDAQLTQAAQLAAYYSQARGSDNVAVDYTQIKFVYPKGGGHVDYKNQKTIFVTPKTKRPL